MRYVELPESILTKKRKRNEIIAAYANKEEVAQEFATALDGEDKQKVAVVLRAAGLPLARICEALDIPQSEVTAILRKDESQKILTFVRSVQKQELVVNGLVLQRKYLESLLSMPASPSTAAAHGQLVKALATLYDKSALAAGEATDRIETRNININLDEKRAMWEQLRQSQEMRLERDTIAIEAGVT